ncbi:MAG TPA: hypothetical protein VFT78_04745 [Hanamia sp.]|jgi:hypothetical protein|nr:hypothetical protein [Hanamia sp.]
MKNYIGQLNGKEQNAVYCIRKLIANQLNALIIYCFGCKTNVCMRRSAFIKSQFKEERQFTCDLLIITPDATVVDEEKRAEIQEMIRHFGTVNMVIHPLGFVLKQMNEGNLFFNWVHKEGMLLMDRNNSTQLLPQTVESAYRPQASQYYLSNPAMNDYLEVKFQPIIKPESKKASPVPSQPVEIKLTLDAANGWQPTATKM